MIFKRKIHENLKKTAETDEQAEERVWCCTPAIWGGSGGMRNLELFQVHILFTFTGSDRWLTVASSSRMKFFDKLSLTAICALI